MWRCTLIVWLIAPIAALAQELPKPVRIIMKDYEATVAQLGRARDADITAAWKAVDDRLDSLLKEVMKRAELEEANRINALRDELRSRFLKRSTATNAAEAPRSTAARGAKAELTSAVQKLEADYTAQLDKTAKSAIDALDAAVKSSLQGGNLNEANQISAHKKRFETQIKLAGKFPPGPLVVYTFDRDTFFKKDNKEYVRDLSGNDNHLLADDIKPVPGRVAGAIATSGKNSKLTSVKPIGISGESPRTISVWTYFENVPGGRFQHIVGWGEPENRKAFFISTFEGAVMAWSHGMGNDWGTGHKAAAKTWQHHAITYDGKTVTWYIDGTPLPKTFDIKYATADTPLTSGGTPVSIDELAVYSRALTSEEIRQLLTRPDPK